VVGQRLAHPRGAERAAAERDDLGAAAERLEHDLLLDHAERGLALAVEEVADGLAEPRDDQVVAVDAAHRPGRRRLPGAHEAD
jgi:hypothetical protein